MDWNDKKTSACGRAFTFRVYSLVLSPFRPLNPGRGPRPLNGRSTKSFHFRDYQELLSTSRGYDEARHGMLASSYYHLSDLIGYGPSINLAPMDHFYFDKNKTDHSYHRLHIFNVGSLNYALTGKTSSFKGRKLTSNNVSRHQHRILRASCHELTRLLALQKTVYKTLRGH
jgi:hypothetical protein